MKINDCCMSEEWTSDPHWMRMLRSAELYSEISVERSAEFNTWSNYLQLKDENVLLGMSYLSDVRIHTDRWIILLAEQLVEHCQKTVYAFINYRTITFKSISNTSFQFFYFKISVLPPWRIIRNYQSRCFPLLHLLSLSIYQLFALFLLLHLKTNKNSGVCVMPCRRAANFTSFKPEFKPIKPVRCLTGYGNKVP